MNDTTLLWEEKNLTEPEKNCSNNNGPGLIDITNETKTDLMLSPCEDTGKERMLTPTQIIQRRYYHKHWDKIKKKAKLKREKEKLMRLKKLCPVCNKEMYYTNKGNLRESIKKKLQCKSCIHKEQPYKFLFNYLIYICKRRKIDCNLTYEEFVKFTETNKCSYCHDEIIWKRHNINQKNRPSARYNLDRMNNELGYTAENCCVCCPTCNNIKSNRFTPKEMAEIGSVLKHIREKKHGKN